MKLQGHRSVPKVKSSQADTLHGLSDQNSTKPLQGPYFDQAGALNQGILKGVQLKGSFKNGGTVPETGAYQLHQGETVIPNSGSNPFGNPFNTQNFPNLYHKNLQDAVNESYTHDKVLPRSEGQDYNLNSTNPAHEGNPSYSKES